MMITTNRVLTTIAGEPSVGNWRPPGVTALNGERGSATSRGTGVIDKNWNVG